MGSNSQQGQRIEGRRDCAKNSTPDLEDGGPAKGMGRGLTRLQGYAP